MEKVIVEPKQRENIKFTYNNVEIEVIPYITVTDEISLISNYVNAYFYPNQDSSFGYLKEGNYDYWQANFGLVQKIMQDYTNVDVDFGQTDANEMIELFFEVAGCISNYSQFKQRLDKTVDAIKDSETIGNTVDNLINKISLIVDNFSNIDPEKLKELADSIVGKMESSSVAEIFTEASKETPPITKQTKTRKVKESKE